MTVLAPAEVLQQVSNAPVGDGELSGHWQSSRMARMYVVGPVAAVLFH